MRVGMPVVGTVQTITVHRGPRPDGTWHVISTHRSGDTIGLPATKVDVAVADVVLP